MRLGWTRTADKRGIAHEDAIFAMTGGRLWFVAKFERSRIPGTPDPSLFVGYARDGVTMLEVMVEPEEPNTLIVYHVMQARPRIVGMARRRGVTPTKEEQ